MKKLLAILICLMLLISAMVLASCGGIEDDGGSSGSQSSVADGSGDNSTGGSTDSSGGGDERAPDSSTNTDGSTDVSTNASVDNGGNTDQKKETVFVVFRANGAGVDFDGATTVEIEKGNSLNPTQTPEASRDGYYLVGWAYDARGTVMLKTTDVFEIDTVLYAVWAPDGMEDGRITVSFTCMSGTYQYGETEIKINTGSSISTSQMPVYTRKNYVLVWSYDMFGEELWSARDVFNEDTELYATWIRESEYFDVINAYLYTVGSVQMTDILSDKNGNPLLTTVTKYDGLNVYSGLSASQDSGLAGTNEEYWYVDGIFYSSYGGEKIKEEITPDFFEADVKAFFVGPDRIFQLKKEAVTNVTKNGNEYLIEVDASKYAGLGAVTGVEIEYTRFTMTVTFDDGGEIVQIKTDYAYTVNGGPLTELVSVTEFSSIGETAVEAPSDAGEYIEKQ